MLLLAVSVMEKLRHLPRKSLINLGLGVLVLVVAVFLFKQARKMNRFVLFGVILVMVVVFCFNWVYYRNEPKFLTPVVDYIAPFFPSAPKQKDHW